MAVFEKLKDKKHEQLIFFREPVSGLRAIVAIHDTTLGPAIGGVRMRTYSGEDEAIEDALRLSRSMTYKAAGAGVNFGGGQTVVMGDPRKDKSEALWRALGRFIDGMGGRYVAGQDVGTSVDDMDNMRTETRYVVGIPSSRGGSGDPSPVCAFGVVKGLEACRLARGGSDDLRDLHVAVQGLGNAGSQVVDMLMARGSRLSVADVDEEAVERITQRHRVDVVDPEAIFDVDCDVFCPCALGGIMNPETVKRLKCVIVAGAANNQLSDEGSGKLLHERGILYAPDYIINAGALINVADEIYGYDRERALRKTGAIKDVLLKVFAAAKENGIPTNEAADRLAEERIEKIGRVKRTFS
ncbi:MAG: Glu/Leu/Phe/Val dehydrogenase dimerization domain-containing protein [bacterium]|jgi:leucine dehydrogenase